MGRREHTHPSIEFVVEVAVGDELLTENVLACTRHAAAAAGEAMYQDGKAVSVSRRWNIAGRCSRCRSVVFAGELARISGRQLICGDC